MTKISFDKQKILVRSWKSNPWEFLPTSLQKQPLSPWALHGLPEEIKSRMSRRGHDCIGYPYPRLAYLDKTLSLRNIDITILENNRFRMLVGNRLGPRILEIYDQDLNTPMVLPVTAMNSAMFGTTGAWFPGGIEFNAFRYGHTPFFDQELPLEKVEFKDGELGLHFDVLDELVNMRYTLTIRLFSDGVSWRIRIENLLDIEQPLYWWTNMAAPVGEDTLLLYEPGPVINHSLNPGFETQKWPYLWGHDSSKWGGHVGMSSAYWHQCSNPYMGFYEPRLGSAVVHASDISLLKGRKLWAMGAKSNSEAWRQRLHEHGLENYCEIQAGLTPTQIEYARIKPKEVITWSESLWAMQFDESATYEKTWEDFVRRSESTGILREHAKDTHWEINRSKVVVEVSPRQDSALKALLAMDSEDTHVIEALSAESNLNFGWRAGVAWDRILEKQYKKGSFNRWVALQYAASLTTRQDYHRALDVMADTCHGTRTVDGLILRLKAAILRHQGDLSEAGKAIGGALDCEEAEPVWWKEAFEIFRAMGDHSQREQLLSRCPNSMKELDSIRLEEGYLYFDQGDFAKGIEVLDAEMFDVHEGWNDPWRLWRECLIAWGLKLWQEEKIEAAYKKFYWAAQGAPQFGVGRRETDDNEAPLFYRWWLAERQGDHLMSKAIASQLMRRTPHPSSDNAVYLLRIAVATKHRSAHIRREKINRWQLVEQTSKSPEPVWRTAMLETLDKGKVSALWDQVPHTDIFKYRAAFERRTDDH